MKRTALRTLLIASLWTALPAQAESPPLVVVIPLTAHEAALSASDKALLFEMVRTGAADELNPVGFNVLAAENTYELLRAQGVEPTTLECEGDCALELANKIGAGLFISGSVTRTEGLLVVYLRLFEQRDGRQVSSLKLEGALVQDLRRQFDQQRKEFFAKGVARLDPDQRPAASVIRSARKNDGFLNVASDPPADVTVDGEAVGRTPLRRLPVSAGSHVVVLTAPMRRSAAVEVVVNAGAEAQVKQTLTPSSATLDLSAEPGNANVKLDGRRVAPGQVATSAGKHRLDADADGYAPETRTFSVEEGQTASARLTLRARPVRVVLSANLEGSCELDGRSYKVQLRPTLAEVMPGRYPVSCVRDRAASVARELVAKAGESATLVVEFKEVKLGQSETEPKSGLVFLQVSPGSASLGCLPGDGCDATEAPPRTERVEPFSLGRTETTVAAFSACVSAGACGAEPLQRAGTLQECSGPAGRQTHPINCVSQTEAQAFCAWIGGRLPSDAEWEYATRLARPSQVPAELNGCDTSCWGRFHLPWANRTAEDGFSGTAPVASYAAPGSTAFTDLLGNVAEWTSSDPDGSLATRSVRGGGWNSSPATLTPGARAALAPSDWSEAVGFRCVR